MANQNKYVTSNGTELVMTAEQANVYSNISELRMIQENVGTAETVADPTKKAPKYEKVADLNKADERAEPPTGDAENPK